MKPLREPLLLWILLCWALAPVAAGAEISHLVLDPVATEITFVLPTTVTEVRGRARLESGEISFDPAGGRASGRIVVDAGSTRTGIDLRDLRMHHDVLEVARFPTIAFLPEAVEIVTRGPTHSEILLRGRIAIHGSEHPLAIPALVSLEGEELHIEARFAVPYVAWGMQDVKTLFLGGSPRIDVRISARAMLARRPPRDSGRASRTRARPPLPLATGCSAGGPGRASNQW